MPIVKVYGIKACDTMKKARAWLESKGVDYEFHDYKSRGIDRATVAKWVSEAGWERVLNRKGTTFRQLPETDRTDLTADRAIDLMVAYPSMIKRPVVEGSGPLLLGFSPDDYNRLAG